MLAFYYVLVAPVRYGRTEHLSALVPLAHLPTTVAGAVCFFSKKFEYQATYFFNFEYVTHLVVYVPVPKYLFVFYVPFYYVKIPKGDQMSC